MPALIAFLVNALRAMLYVHLAKMVVGVLLFFGISLTVNKVAIQPIISMIQGMMGAGPGGQFGGTAMTYMGILRIDDAVSMMLSAWMIVYSIKSARIGLSKVGV